MYAVWGSVLIAGAVLGMMLLSLLVRHPAASAWARSELIAMLGSVVIAGAFGLGLAWLAMAPKQLAADGVSLAGIALVAAIWVGLVVVLWLLKPGARLSAYDAAAAAGPTLAVSNPEPLPPPTPRPRSGGRTTKAA